MKSDYTYCSGGDCVYVWKNYYEALSGIVNACSIKDAEPTLKKLEAIVKSWSPQN